MAVPSAVAYSTVIGLPLGADRLTVNTASTVPESPSTTVTSSIERLGGGSSSSIVPVPCPTAIVAFVGLDSSTVNVSSNSSSTSPSTATAIVRLVAPGSNVSVPLAPT